MPVTIRTAAIEYKSPTTGEYVGVDAIETGNGSGDLSSIAPNYEDLTFPVAKGQYCYHNNNLYISKQNISSEVWTPSHWEITTVGEMLSKLDNDLKNEIDEKAPAIIAESEEKNKFTAQEIASYGNAFSIIGNTSGYTKIFTAKGLPIYPDSDALTSDEVVTKGVGNTLYINGAYSSAKYKYFSVNGTNYAEVPVTIAQDNQIALAVTVKGEITYTGSGSAGSPFVVSVYMQSEEEQKTELRTSIGMDVVSGKYMLTAPYDTVSLRVVVLIRKDYTYSNVEFSFEIFDSSTEVTEKTVSGSTEVIDKEDVGSGGFTIFPVKGKANYIADTKEYVDNHIPSDVVTVPELEIYEPTLANLKYITPEMFGAKGDGVTDDAAAIQACLDEYASLNSSGPAIRGLGSYKITQPIVINTSTSNIYFRTIIYTGNDCAVIMTGEYNNVRFDRIYAYNSTGAGFRLKTTSTKDASYNQINLGVVYAYANGIEIINDYGASDLGFKQIYYNRFYVQYLHSRYGNCFYLSGETSNSQIGENSFWGKRLGNSNGYAIYVESSKAFTSCRFYEFCIESASKNGVFGGVTLINCRTTEMMDQYDGTGTTGIIYKTTSGLGFRSSGTNIWYNNVDVSEAKTFDDYYEDLKSRVLAGNDSSLTFARVFKDVASGSKEIGRASSLGNYYSGQPYPSEYSVPGSVIVYYNHKGFVPDIPVYKKIDAATFATLFDGGIVPTYFDIDIDTTITLDDSYCCIGVHEIIVKQYANKKAQIYDRHGNLIFDGANNTEGTYKLHCIMTPMDIVVEREGRSPATYPARTYKGMFYDTNEMWYAEKMTIV